jgi:NAD(P)H-dependent FMN reductase
MSLNIAVIYGSVRGERRQGIKAARFVVNQLEARGHDVTLVDPLEYELPLLDRMYKEFEPGEAPDAMQRVGRILKDAEGFIIVSGEYNHAEPAALKNLLDHYQSEYLYKPSGIVTYSAGPFGGVRALITLRAVLAELGTPSIPSAFPISKIGDALDDEGNAVEQAYDRRIGKFLDEFEWYANALRNARQQACPMAAAPMQQNVCRGQDSG